MEFRSHAKPILRFIFLILIASGLVILVLIRKTDLFTQVVKFNAQEIRDQKLIKELNDHINETAKQVNNKIYLTWPIDDSGNLCTSNECIDRLAFKDISTNKFYFLNLGNFPTTSISDFSVSPDERYVAFVITSFVGDINGHEVFNYDFVFADLKKLKILDTKVQLRSDERGRGYSYSYAPLDWQDNKLFFTVLSKLGFSVGVGSIDIKTGAKTYIIYPSDQYDIEIVAGSIKNNQVIVFKKDNKTDIGRLERINYVTKKIELLVDFSQEPNHYYIGGDIWWNENLNKYQFVYQVSNIPMRSIDSQVIDKDTMKVYHPEIILLNLDTLEKITLIKEFNLRLGAFDTIAAWIDDTHIAVTPKENTDAEYILDIVTKKLEFSRIRPSV